VATLKDGKGAPLKGQRPTIEVDPPDPNQKKVIAAVLGATDKNGDVPIFVRAQTPSQQPVTVTVVDPRDNQVTQSLKLVIKPIAIKLSASPPLCRPHGATRSARKRSPRRPRIRRRTNRYLTSR